MTTTALTGCMNGHDPEDMELRPSGARICTKCANFYHGRTRTALTTKTPYRKVNNHYERHTA
jgi:hypothetical protein